ncbi:hypothetical protein TNCV_4412311 [Trichonephila clavipes]|nr:hypothetical protein TNCV_4412311 [Trichonephila clavipes]
MPAADIHRHVTEVYGTETMSDSKVQNQPGSLKMGTANIWSKESKLKLPFDEEEQMLRPPDVFLIYTRNASGTRVVKLQLW